MKLRIVKAYRNENTRFGAPKFYIQGKFLWMWSDIDPDEYDSVFYGRGTSWDTFEEAQTIYFELESILNIPLERKEEVVWPPVKRDF